MSDEIRADYDQLENVAGRFASQSQVIQELLQKVNGSMDKLESNGWKGRGSDAFFQEMHSEVLPASQRLQDVLAQANQVTRTIIQTVKQAEAEASTLFRSAQ
jgi:WXG100 family type VII secretion target